MKHKHNAGFSLIEVLVAMAVLGVIVIPICSSLVLSFRMNAKTDAMLQAQLAVSSAVETLMAEGISGEKVGYDVSADGTDRFPDVTVVSAKVTDNNGNLLPYYKVTVTDGIVTAGENGSIIITDDLVTVTTHIRAVEATSSEEEGNGE